MAGVMGNSPRAAVVDMARGSVVWVVWVRHGVVEFVVWGEIVSAMA